MEKSRLTNSLSNISSGLVFRFVSLIINFLSRTVFIRILGDGCLGLNGLFTSLLSMLSLADLGIGQAITFYMYKPIAEKDEHRLTSLIGFYKICYRIIGISILVIGICIVPFLPKLVKLEIETGYNITIIYLLYLFNTVVTYLFFSYPQTILNANQKQYVVNKNESRFVIISVIAEISVLIISRNYMAYLVVKIIISIMKNTVLAIVSIRMFPYIKSRTYKGISKSEISVMLRDVYAIFVVKLSSQLFNSTDNLFISAMFGTILAGYNSNYLMIINAVYGIINTIIYSCGSSVGNLFATNTLEKTEEVFSVLDFINRWISCLCTACLFQLLNPFITIFWGEKYIFSLPTVILMCTNFYIVSSLYALFSFRQSMGLFRYCIYNQLIAAVTNIVLDYILGNMIGINGIFLATIIANIGIAVLPYTKNLYQVGFKMSYKSYVIKIFKGYLLCLVSCSAVNIVCKPVSISFSGFLYMAILSLAVPNIFQVLFWRKSNEMKVTFMYINKITNKHEKTL